MAQAVYDDFNRADGALGSAWSIHLADGGNISVLEHSAVGTVAGGGDAIALARSVAAIDHVEQYGAITFITSVVGSRVRLGFHSAVIDPTPGGDVTIGFAADVEFVSLTSCRVAIVTNPFGSGLQVNPGMVEQTTIAPLLNIATCADVVQELRAEVRRSASGLELLVWFNSDDDDRPLLRHRFVQDAPAGGKPYFLLWNDEDTSLLRAGDVQFAVRRQSSGTSVTSVAPESRPTLKYIRESAIEWWESRSHSPNSEPSILNRFANDAQQDMLQRLGDMAVFMRVEEDIDLELDTNQCALLPRRVELLLGLRPRAGAFEYGLKFHTVGYSADGRQKIRVPDGSTSVTMLYEPVVEDMVADYDRSVIPSKYKEALVAGVVRRMARDDKNVKDYKLYDEEYEAALARARLDLMRHQRSRNSVMQVRPTVEPRRPVYGDTGA